jgi:hypothetical protein
LFRIFPIPVSDPTISIFEEIISTAQTAKGDDSNIYTKQENSQNYQLFSKYRIYSREIYIISMGEVNLKLVDNIILLDQFFVSDQYRCHWFFVA